MVLVFFASGERCWSHFGSNLAQFWKGLCSDFEVRLRLLWGLFSLLFFLACFGFFGFLGLFVALRLAFSRGFSGIEPESRERTVGKLRKRSQL